MIGVLHDRERVAKYAVGPGVPVSRTPAHLITPRSHERAELHDHERLRDHRGAGAPGGQARLGTCRYTGLVADRMTCQEPFVLLSVSRRGSGSALLTGAGPLRAILDSIEANVF